MFVFFFFGSFIFGEEKTVADAGRSLVRVSGDGRPASLTPPLVSGAGEVRPSRLTDAENATDAWDRERPDLRIESRSPLTWQSSPW